MGTQLTRPIPPACRALRIAVQHSTVQQCPVLYITVHYITVQRGVFSVPLQRPECEDQQLGGHFVGLLCHTVGLLSLSPFFVKVRPVLSVSLYEGWADGEGDCA